MVVVIAVVVVVAVVEKSQGKDSQMVAWKHLHGEKYRWKTK
jgi:hypothetical protein